MLIQNQYKNEFYLKFRKRYIYTQILFIIEEAKETVLDFPKGTMKVV